uniref:Secreted protein n=1 Tax=Ciona intestinalis TaxID=7719 RepID=H2XJG3_CIOIN
CKVYVLIFIGSLASTFVFSPFQTSPNIPAPNFFSNLRDSRGISHTSLAIVIVWGFSKRGQGSSRRQHKPSVTSAMPHK